MNDTEKRAEYVAGLRALADLLEQHGDLPLPYGAGTGDEYDSYKIQFFAHTKEEAQTFARLLPGKLDKRVDDGPFGFELHGSVRGLYFMVNAPREEVCERVVTGTRQVVKHVPDPTAEPVPLIEVVETVEDVEWVCKPLLSEVAS